MFFHQISLLEDFVIWGIVLGEKGDADFESDSQEDASTFKGSFEKF